MKKVSVEMVGISAIGAGLAVVLIVWGVMFVAMSFVDRDSERYRDYLESRSCVIMVDGHEYVVVSGDRGVAMTHSYRCETCESARQQ